MPRRLSSEQIKEQAAKAQALAAKRRRRITILQTQLQEQTQRDHQRTLFQLGTLVEAAGLAALDPDKLIQALTALGKLYAHPPAWSVWLHGDFSHDWRDDDHEDMPTQGRASRERQEQEFKSWFPLW